MREGENDTNDLERRLEEYFLADDQELERPPEVWDRLSPRLGEQRRPGWKRRVAGALSAIPIPKALPAPSARKALAASLVLVLAVGLAYWGVTLSTNGDDDGAIALRPRGTASPVATSAPPTAAPATAAPPTTAPTATTAPVATVAAEPTQAPAAAAGGDAAAGPAVFAGKGCVVCHTIQGLAGAVGQIGPELTHVATNAGTRVAGMSAEAYIRQAIEDPPAFVVEGFGPIMPTTIRSTMSDTEFEDLVAYLLTRN